MLQIQGVGDHPFTYITWKMWKSALNERTSEDKSVNYTYILRCSDNTFYTGWTNHLEERVKAHNAGRGAKYTRSRTPVELIYYEAFATKQEAMRREAEIKKYSRRKKEGLIISGECSVGNSFSDSVADGQQECDIQIEGGKKMNYIIADKPSFKVIGIRRTTPYGGGTWAIVKSDGSNEKIKEISGKFFDLGLCFGFGEDGSDDYMCAVEWEGADVEGFDSFAYPAAQWLIFEAKGKISDNVLGNVWHRINNEFLPNSKYKKCMATIEKYAYWNDDEDACDVEIWIPVEVR